MRTTSPTGALWRVGWIALGLTGAAVNTGNNLLYLLLGILVGAAVVDRLIARRTLRTFDVELYPPRFARAGSPFVFEIRLRHRGAGPDARGLGITLVSRGTTLGSAWVERVPRHETVVVRMTVRLATRGVHPIDGIIVRSTFPFDLFRTRRRLGPSTELVVAPSGGRPDAEARAPLNHPGGAVAAQRIAGDEYEGLRRGSEREDVRRIDWKSTARRGELMLRETTGEARARVVLRLRTTLADHSAASRRRFETELAGVAATGQQALDRGAAVELTLDDATVERFDEPSAVRFLARISRLRPTGPDGTFLSPEPANAAPAPAPAATSPERTAPDRAHALSARAASAVGMTSLWWLGGLMTPFWALALAVLLATTIWPRQLVARSAGLVHRLWLLAAFSALIAFVAQLLLAASPLNASVHLVLFITVYMACNARSAHDDRMMLLVSLLHIVLAAAFTTEIVFAPFLAAWLFAALHGQIAWSSTPVPATGWRPVALAPPGGPLRYGRLAALSTVSVLLAGLVVFMLVPHFGTGTFSPGRDRGLRASGFSDSASLGDIGRIKLDTTPVMEVELVSAPPANFDLKWRGVALDVFDGRTWSRGTAREQAIPGRTTGVFRVDPGGSTERPFVQRVRLEPDASGVVFAAERSVEIRSRDIGYMVRDDAGALRAPAARRTLHYTALSNPVAVDPARLRAVRGTDPDPLARRNLALPAIDPRIAKLAHELTDAALTRYDAARGIERWLATERTYTLAVNDRGSDDPLADFLIDGKPGHCEYFATSMVVLARAAGIPARFVTGYLRGEPNRFRDSYVVRRSDAHAWVEIHFPGQGWVAFDPTPPAGRESLAASSLAGDLFATVTRWWDDELIGIDLDDQVQRAIGIIRSIDLARIAGMLLMAAVAVVAFRLAAPYVAGFRDGRRRNSARVPRSYRATLRELRRRGFTRTPEETPNELLARAASTLEPSDLARLRGLTADYYRLRFGPPSSSSSDSAAA